MFSLSEVARIPNSSRLTNNNGSQWMRHKTRSLGMPTVISDLFCPVTGNHSLCNGQLLKMKDAINAENYPLVTNITDDTLDGSIPQALDSLHSLGNTNKAQVKYMCVAQMQSCYELCIGNGCQIPRWRKGSEIFYVICTESFETPDVAALVAAAMTEAISMWGKITGVVFKEVGRAAPATFRIKYKKSHNSCPNVYAKSFLPTESASSLVVYQKALENSSYLANILAHELGHILGLRHEFALKTEEFLPSVRFGSENYQSIMNYFDHPSKFRVSEQDREELAAFYAFGQAHYQGLSIVDVTPPLKDDW